MTRQEVCTLQKVDETLEVLFRSVTKVRTELTLLTDPKFTCVMAGLFCKEIDSKLM